MSRRAPKTLRKPTGGIMMTVSKLATILLLLLPFIKPSQKLNSCNCKVVYVFIHHIILHHYWLSEYILLDWYKQNWNLFVIQYFHVMSRILYFPPRPCTSNIFPERRRLRIGSSSSPSSASECPPLWRREPHPRTGYTTITDPCSPSWPARMPRWLSHEIFLKWIIKYF